MVVVVVFVLMKGASVALLSVVFCVSSILLLCCSLATGARKLREGARRVSWQKKMNHIR